MNHGTILQQYSRGSASEMIFAVSVRVHLNHEPWGQHVMIVFCIFSCLCSSQSRRVMIITIFVHVCLIHEPWNHALSSKTVGGWHVMIITISVRVCLIYEPWNHCPHIIVMIDSVSSRVGFGHESWSHL